MLLFRPNSIRLKSHINSLKSSCLQYSHREDDLVITIDEIFSQIQEELTNSKTKLKKSIDSIHSTDDSYHPANSPHPII